MKPYELPPLDYDYAALEPHYSARMLELHHDKHHKAYVDGANTTLEKLHEAREKNDFAAIAALEKALGFHVSGHVLHSIFWQNLTPKGGGQPGGELANQINKDFGSFDKFKAQLTKAASTVMGSGWGALVWEPAGKRLLTTQIHDHQSETAQSSVPLLVLDAWEHAWYLQYKTDKVKFFEALWNVFNWKDVEARFASASKLDLGLRNVVAG
jgi:Fe-Mn family superoxide dismutase